MNITLNRDITRRSMLGMMGAAGLGITSSLAMATGALAKEGTDETTTNVSADNDNDGSSEPLAYEDRPGAGKPWSGPGSESGDWTSTPEDIAALGGCTMPLDELNRRRKLYVDSFGEYTCADGTVIPAAYNQMRALLNTYRWGVGSIPIDSCFTNLVKEVTEDQAKAFLEMPWGQYFRAIDFYDNCNGSRTLEECEEICEHFASKGYLRRSTHGNGTVYNMSGWFEGIGGYLMNDTSMGDPAYAWPIGGDGMADDWGNAGTPTFHTCPCDSSTIDTEQILAFDDIEKMILSNNKFALTPCSCRYTMLINNALENGEDYPSFADFGTGEYEDTAFVDDVRVETCICMGDEAEYWVNLGTARWITQDEALERIHRSRDEGFIIECTRERTGEYVCSCRTGYCNVIAFWEALAESRGSIKNVAAFDRQSDYDLEVDFDNCLRCGTCAGRCPMKAITMDGEYNGETGYPQVSEMCFHCGQCAYVCPQQIRKLVLRPEEERLSIIKDGLVDDYNMKAGYRFEQGMMY
jgi:ferredoxin